MSETAVEPLGQQPDPLEEARDAATEPFTDVYHNPRESSSRMGLEARAYAYRAGASLAFGMGNMVSPAVPSPHMTVYFDSTFSEKYGGKDKIRAYVWTPDRPRMGSRKSSKESVKSLKREERRERKEEKRRERREKKGGRRGGAVEAAVVEGTSDQRPSLSRLSTRASLTDDETSLTDDAAAEKRQAKRPSTLSRLSSRLSNKSSKSLRSTLSRSKSSLSLRSTPSASQADINPMDKIPTLLTPQADPRSRRPAVINFHGGGFVLGQGTDDGRWAMAVMQALGAVVFSVEYRLAPSYPFPTPVEDCADAVLQIWRRADEFWIDRDRIMVSGFSAGGTLALASWVLLADYKRWGYEVKPGPDLAEDMSALSVGDRDGMAAEAQEEEEKKKKPQNKADPKVPQPAGLMLFYPLLDWTQSRPRKRLTCSRPELTLSRSLTDLFDASYLYPYEEVKSQLDNPLLSPGLMPDDLLDRLPPVQLCLCEYDMLLAEGRRFYERLQARKKESGVREVEGAKHAWDKPSGLLYSPPESMGTEYGEAVRVMARWIGREEGNGSGEDLSQREKEREAEGNLRHPEV